MFRCDRALSILVSACLLAGCALPNGIKKTGSTLTREGSLKGGLKGKVVKSPGQVSGDLKVGNGANVIANNSSGIVSNNAGGVISNNAGSLAGDVICPAGLISNNGGGIISNNSSGYHVMATVSEQALAGATVSLVDAAGNAVKGADGKPLTAKTDAKGHYEFQGILPANNLLVVVDLGAKGALKAIATKSGGTKRTTNVSLISTLTTGYILDQYVKGQPDPVKTLDKLPANIETATRTKAATAFSANGVATPSDLTASSVVTTVASMRRESAPFDAQMEEVKKLLIAAGQSDLGAGRPALEVDLNFVEQLYVSPTNELQIACGSDRRLWRVDAAGKIQNLAGKGVAAGGSLTGVAGPDAGLGYMINTAQDAQGRLWLLEGPLVEEAAGLPDAGRLNVLGTDGKLTEAWGSVPPGATGVVAGANGEGLVFFFDEEADTPALELWAVKPGQAPQKRTTFDAATSDRVGYYIDSAVGDGQGNVYVLIYDADESQKLLKLAAGASTFTEVANLGEDGMGCLDPHGNLFNWTSSEAITVRKTDGTTVTLLDAPPAPDEGGSLDAAVLNADGSAYLSQNTKVYKVVGKVATAVAGTGTTTATGTGTEIAVKPAGMAMGKDGSLYFTDEENGYIMRLGTDQQVTRFAGGEGSGDDVDGPADGSLAKDADLFGAGGLQADAAGNLYVLTMYGVYKIDAAGKMYRVYKPATEDDQLDDFAVASDGAIYVAETNTPQTDDNAPSTVSLKRKAAGASTATVLKSETSDEASYTLCVDGANVLVAEPTGKLTRWTSAGAQQALATNAIFGEVSTGGMAIDASGRLIVCDASRVCRFDLTTKALTVLGGRGGKVFTGNTVDTSLDYPGYPVFDKDGNLVVADTGHRQIKRIPKDQL